MIWRNKRFIKKSDNFSVSEQLTEETRKLLKLAKEYVGPRNAWSDQCCVYAIVNMKKKLIRTREDLPSEQMADQTPIYLKKNDGRGNDSTNNASSSRWSDHASGNGTPISNGNATYNEQYPTQSLNNNCQEYYAENATNFNNTFFNGRGSHNYRGYTRGHGGNNRNRGGNSGGHGNGHGRGYRGNSRGYRPRGNS